ncbi:hypothetical protein INR49_032125 [Caranx melampygus]|nr:hypothetical protein INR49_032125 [Caranx melampygus]
MEKSALLQARPPLLPGQIPRQPPPTPGTHNGETDELGHDERGKNCLNICWEKNCTISHFRSFVDTFFVRIPIHPFVPKGNKLCVQWKDVKTSPDTELGHKLRPSEPSSGLGSDNGTVRLEAS